MRKILLTAFILALATPAWAAQQSISTITTKQSREELRGAINTELGKVQSNTTELYSLAIAAPWLAQATAPSVTNVFWVDTSGASPVIKYYDGDSWEVAAAGEGGTYTLPVATSSILGGVKQGTGTSIAVDGTISVTASGVGLGTTDNVSFLSLHASGGNLAAANAQVTKKWITGLPYVADVTSVIHGGKHYICTSNHTAGSTTEPGVGASWATVWVEAVGATTLDGLTDVDTTGAANGSIIKHNGTSWVIGTDSTGSGSVPDGTVNGQVLTWLTNAWVAGSAPWLRTDALGTGVATALGFAPDTTGGFMTKAAYDAEPELAAGAGITFTSGAGTLTVSVTANTYLGAAQLDDTKGNGDTTFIWSADKVYDQLALKAPLESPVFTTSAALPQGASPTVDAAGEIAIDTTSDQLIYYGAAKRVLTHKKQIDFAVKTPVDADDFLLFKAQTAITITDIHVIAQGGTSISVDIQECDAAGANCSTVDAAITADTDGAEDDGTLSNGTIDAGDWVKVVLGAPSGTVNYLAGSIYYVETAD